MMMIDDFQVIILQDKLDEKDKELERVKKEMEEVVVADDVGDKKDDEAHDDDEDPKEIDDGEQKMLCTFWEFIAIFLSYISLSILSFLTKVFNFMY